MLAAFEIHHLYQLIEKGGEIIEISIFSIHFSTCHSLLLSERKTISEILIKASKFTAPRAFSINKQCVPYVYRQLHQQRTLRSILDNKS